ncbi:MAG: hypothetical protein OEY51_13505, partial [Cyclobacteriaceae bacterium]|nr:hypothetical protein [Cyclobacteriaceae bacterium]
MDVSNKFKRGWMVFILAFMPLLSMAQFPIRVQVEMPPPYPYRLSEYTDFNSRIYVTVFNESSVDQEFVITGSLKGRNSGISIQTDINNLPDACIFLPAYSTTTLTGAALSDVFDPSHLVFSGTTLSSILNDQALPEDNYELCLRAFKCGDSRVALSEGTDNFTSCARFDVAYLEPPLILTPSCGLVVPEENPIIYFNWLVMPPLTGMGATMYKFRVVELDPMDTNPYDAMLTGPIILEKFIYTTDLFLNLTFETMLEAGKMYAYQIVAVDPTGTIKFRNDGASQVCTFYYGHPNVSSTGTRINFEPVYPKRGDYIPFDFFPFIVRFDPYSKDYYYFTGDMQLLKDGSVVDSKHKENDWTTYGPVRGQNKAITRNPDATLIGEWQSRHLPVYKNATDGPHVFDKNSDYSWSFDGNMRLPDGSTVSGGFGDTGFNVGMSPSILQTPANGTTVAPGNVEFSWTTAEKPFSLVPPFHIYQASATGTKVDVNLFNSIINERWAMEVSDTDTFDEIIYATNGRITGQYVDDSVALINNLYKQVNASTSVTEPGTYYWRVKWLSNVEDTTSAPYRTSPVWNFTIGTGGAAATDTEVARTPERP